MKIMIALASLEPINWTCSLINGKRRGAFWVIWVEGGGDGIKKLKRPPKCDNIFSHGHKRAFKRSKVPTIYEKIFSRAHLRKIKRSKVPTKCEKKSHAH